MTASQTVVDALQSSVVELIDLRLNAKQAHWNVTGSQFRPLHLQLDEMAAEYLGWTDTLAERMTAIGAPPDGRASTVASTTEIEPPTDGWLDQGKVLDYFVSVLERVSARFRERVQATGDADPATQDLLIEVQQGLEKQLWMLRAQTT